MADINLTQAEADSLIAMEKHRLDDTVVLFPGPGERISIPLTSQDKRENFMLDVTRSQIKLTKATYQNRARQAIVLMRLDLDGPPHRNPDDTEIPCPHLHIYREGYGESGRSSLRPTFILLRALFFRSFRRLCVTVTSRRRLFLNWGCFHERR